MEKKILNILEFDLYAPTSITFLKLYNQIFEFSPNITITSLYLADLMLLAINSHLYPPSLLASAYMFISVISNNDKLPDENNERMR